MKKILALLIAVLVMGTASMSFAFDEGQEKGNWYFGLGIGTGSGEVSPDSGDSISFNDLFIDHSQIAYNVAGGVVVNPFFHLGLEMSFTRLTFTDIDASIQFNSYMLAGLFFPMERGLYLKAGVGLASISTTDSGATSTSEEDGTAFMGGIGFMFNFGSELNLGIGIDYISQSYDGGSFNTWNVFASLYWF